MTRPNQKYYYSHDDAYCILIDIDETVLWKRGPGVPSYKVILTLNYAIDIKLREDTQYWIDKLLNLKAFS